MADEKLEDWDKLGAGTGEIPEEPTVPLARAISEEAAATELTDQSALAAATDDVVDDDVAEAAPEDALTQEALARRVAALGDDDATETIARQEEEKLAERRRAASDANKRKKKGGKSALETAASKRLGKIGTKAAPRRALPTAADADPLIDRTVAFRKWANDNARAVQGIVAVLVLALAGGVGWTYYQQKRDEAASTALAAAIGDEHGRIGDAEKEKEKEDDGPKDPRPIFKTAGDMKDSALAKYREVEAKYPGTGAAILSQLGEGSLLLDKRDAAGAATAFEAVKSSALAKADAEVRGRALEGLGMSYELLATTKPDDAKANLDKALTAYKELENTVDVLGFHELGMYDQARVLEAQGSKDAAIEQLKSLHERLAKPGEASAFPYLQEVADDRLRALDPKAAPPKAPAGMGGMGGMPGMMGGAGGAPGGMDQEQLRKMIEQMQRQQQGKK